MFVPALISLVLAQAPSLKESRALVDDLYAARSGPMWKRASVALKTKVGSEAGLGQVMAATRNSLGREVRVITESLVDANGGTLYRRVSAVTNWARGMELELAFDADGRLTGMTTRPAVKEAPTVTALHKTKTPLRLPFDGPWYVLWGGRKYDDNRHTPVPDMRYAMDVFIVKGPGTFQGSGGRNEDYWAWGQPMLAPADGVVVAVENGVPDNVPNQPRPGVLYGNTVVIDHGTGEFSLLGHLQKGSVSVKVGDRVVAGQQVARCGNSGMSTEPHLHYQLMDDAEWTKAQGLPAQFRGYLANGRLVETGEPLRTQVVSHAAVEARRETARESPAGE
ncbi:MAG: M23 family metallopeptidase [Myxococcaceae bacterium]|nr:M23 family metallopeptidase [Myxococcaceae bacterium]